MGRRDERVRRMPDNAVVILRSAPFGKNLLLRSSCLLLRNGEPQPNRHGYSDTPQGLLRVLPGMA